MSPTAIVPSRMSAEVTVSSAILAEVTASSASLTLSIEPSGMEASATPAATFSQLVPLER
jgi:hypothetical protein